MAQSATKAPENIRESQGNHLQDVNDELSRREETLSRLDQYEANAKGHAFLQEFWHNLKYQEQENIKELKRLISDEMKKE